MMRDDLLAALEPCGFREGRIDLPAIWPAIRAWMLGPGDDDRSFYLSRAPGDAAPLDNVFAGSPPDPIAGRDLVCLEFDRDEGRVAVALWYADGPAWAALAEMDGWIDVGVDTPHLDAFARGHNDPSTLTTWIEASPAFAVACDQTPLAAEVADGRGPDAILVLSDPRPGGL